MNRRSFMGGSAAATGGLLTADRAARAASASDLRGDIIILRQALALHPGLYRYNTPRQIEDGLAALEPAFVAASTLEQRYLLLSKFLGQIRCGHTYGNFYNQRKPVAAALFDRPTRLPFAFRWIDDAMVVTRDETGQSLLPIGTVIDEINSMPARAMLATLMLYARADGHNDAKRRSLLEVRGDDRYEYFDAFQGLLFPPIDRVHRVRGQAPGGIRRAYDLPILSLADRRAAMAVDDDDDRPIWRWEMRSDGIAVLTMPSWAMFNVKWKAWRPWLAERLASLGAARALIVDLRENEGGEDCGNEILARLTSKDLHFPAQQMRLRFQKTPSALNPYLETWDNGFRTLGMTATPLGDGFFRRPPIEGVDFIAATRPQVTTPVAALVGPVCSSATFQFALRARQTGLVRLFGAETGGNRRGINGGCFFFVHLPASDIEFDLPLVGYFPSSREPDAGVLPDHRVEMSASDIATGADPCMDAALAWARSLGRT